MACFCAGLDIQIWREKIDQLFRIIDAANERAGLIRRVRGQVEQMRRRIAQVSKGCLPLLGRRRLNGIEQRDFRANKRISGNNLAQRKPAQPLHQRDHMVVGLAQEFEHHCGRAHPVNILRPRILLAFIPLRDQSDDLALRERLIEQLDGGGAAHVEGGDRAGKNNEVAQGQNR